MNPRGPCHVGHPDLPARREAADKHFEIVYNRYYLKIYLICRRYCPKPEDAEDLAHDVFIRYIQNFGTFRHESSPSTWMYRVAVNLGIQRWRREKFRDPDAGALESIPDGAHDNEDMLLDRIALAKILDLCPEPTRRILFLYHHERRTQVEIGHLLGISRSTVTRHLFRLKHYSRRPPHAQFYQSMDPQRGVMAGRLGRPRPYAP
jgi:RNA polymerase sigma-70 factor (ECF subfamily)